MIEWFYQERNRALIYNTAVAVGAIFVFYGLATEAEVAVWLGLVLTVTNGLARSNVSRKHG